MRAREREREKERESCTWLRLCCPLSPPHRRQMTGGGSEGREDGRTQGTARLTVRGPSSVNPSINQSISQSAHWSKNNSALSSLASHPIPSRTTLSDAMHQFFLVKKPKTLHCATHTHIHTLHTSHFSLFSIITTMCCNKKKSSQ